MSKFEFVRTFEHKTYGTIGSVAVEGEATISLDGKELGAESVAYLINFAMQSLQDSYAGAKSTDEAKGNFSKKLNAIREGTLGQRASGGVSEFVKVARSIVKQLLKAKGKDVKDITDAQLDAVYAKNEGVLKPKVEAEVKRRADERKAKARLTDGLDLEM